MFNFLKKIFKSKEKKELKFEIKTTFDDFENKDNFQLEISKEFEEGLKVIFAKHLTSRDKHNIDYVLSNIKSIYIKNPRELFNQLVKDEKLIEMLPTEKLETFTINELKERFEFKKRIKKDIIQEIINKYTIKDISQRTAGIRYKLSEEYNFKYDKIVDMYKNKEIEMFEIVIKNITNFDFLNIQNKKFNRIPTKKDLYNNISNSIPVVNISEDYYIERLKEYNKISMKQYLRETNERIEKFKYFFFSQMTDSGNKQRYFDFFLNGEYLKMNYELYNQKYFDFKRNIEKQIFERFIIFLNIKISNQIRIKDYKKAGLDVTVWNVCPVHKEKAPSIEKINEEIFCTCELV